MFQNSQRIRLGLLHHLKREHWELRYRKLWAAEVGIMPNVWENFYNKPIVSRLDIAQKTMLK